MPCPALSIAIHILPALPKTYGQHCFINFPFGIAEEKWCFLGGRGVLVFSRGRWLGPRGMLACVSWHYCGFSWFLSLAFSFGFWASKNSHALSPQYYYNYYYYDYYYYYSYY